MAAGKNIPELGGYDFEFTSVVPNDLECPVCQLTLKDPINRQKAQELPITSGPIVTQ